MFLVMLRRHLLLQVPMSICAFGSDQLHGRRRRHVRGIQIDYVIPFTLRVQKGQLQ